MQQIARFNQPGSDARSGQLNPLSQILQNPVYLLEISQYLNIKDGSRLRQTCHMINNLLRAIYGVEFGQFLGNMRRSGRIFMNSQLFIMYHPKSIVNSTHIRYFANFARCEGDIWFLFTMVSRDMKKSNPVTQRILGFLLSRCDPENIAHRSIFWSITRNRILDENSFEFMRKWGSCGDRDGEIFNTYIQNAPISHFYIAPNIISQLSWNRPRFMYDIFPIQYNWFVNKELGHLILELLNEYPDNMERSKIPDDLFGRANSETRYLYKPELWGKKLREKSLSIVENHLIWIASLITLSGKEMKLIDFLSIS